MKLPQTSVAVDVTQSRYASFEIRRKTRLPQVVFAGFETVLPTYRVDRDSFPTFAIELVLTGKGSLRINGTDHPLQPGTLFTYGPGIPHLITTDPRTPLRKYFVDLTPTPHGRELSGLVTGLVFATTMPDRMASLIDGILDDSLAGVDFPDIRHDSIGLLLSLAKRSRNMPPPPPGAAYSRYLHAKSHIEANYQLSGCVDDFARALHIDTSYLTRLFQRFGTESPYQYLTRLRLTRARHLLLRHSQSIQQIADGLNFANPFHFSTLFRRHFGVAPSKYHQSPHRPTSRPASHSTRTNNRRTP